MELLKEGGVTAAKGFSAAGAEAGIKYKNRKLFTILSKKSGKYSYIRKHT